MHYEAAIKNLSKLRTAIIKTYEAVAYYLPRKQSSFLCFFFYKTRANTQQVLPVQTGLNRYDEWMVQDINDENLYGS